MASVALLVDAGARLAENPLWDPARRWLYWTDIPAGEVHRARLDGSERTCIYRGPRVGGFTLQEDGALLLFRVDDIALLPADGGEPRRVRGVGDPDMERFNDVIADGRGGVLAGTIGARPGSGGLYRLDPDGGLERLEGRTDLGNGMGFAPDGRTFYWTRTHEREIVAYDVEPGSGALTGRRTVVRVPEDGGVPDGLAIDAEGALWSARYGGAEVVRHASDGRVLERLALPVPNVTAVAFAGDGLDELVITTARGGTGEGAGALYRWRPGVRGRPGHRSRVLL